MSPAWYHVTCTQGGFGALCRCVVTFATQVKLLCLRATFRLVGYMHRTIARLCHPQTNRRYVLTFARGLHACLSALNVCVLIGCVQRAL